VGSRPVRGSRTTAQGCQGAVTSCALIDGDSEDPISITLKRIEGFVASGNSDDNREMAITSPVTRQRPSFAKAQRALEDGGHEVVGWNRDCSIHGSARISDFPPAHAYRELSD